MNGIGGGMPEGGTGGGGIDEAAVGAVGGAMECGGGGIGLGIDGTAANIPQITYTHTQIGILQPLPVISSGRTTKV